MLNHDLGKFYQLLRDLGMWIQDSDFRSAPPFPSNQARDHFLKIASDANPVADWVFEDVVQRPEYAPLAAPLLRDEYQACLKGMRASAAGDDAVTISMWRSAGPAVQDALWALIQHLW